MRFKVSRLQKLENRKLTNKIFINRFPLCLELRIKYTQLTLFEQEYLSYKAYLEALPRATYSLLLFALKVEFQRNSLFSYRPVHQIIQSINQRFIVHRVRLATVFLGIK
jgi:hypothetical protein